MSARPILSIRVPALPAMRADQARVTVAPEVFGCGYDVTVTPPQSVGHDRAFRSYKAALAYAEHLARSMGWALIDHCEGGAS